MIRYIKEFFYAVQEWFYYKYIADYYIDLLGLVGSDGFRVKSFGPLTQKKALMLSSIFDDNEVKYELLRRSHYDHVHNVGF